jgi:hypothetical protein
MATAGLRELIERLPPDLQKQVYEFARFLLERRAESEASRTRVAGLHEGQGRIGEDFDAPLPDDFWLGDA